ncbi:MAG TPA: CpaD family pilus assembly lipoprotein [Sphingomicrobium sp.]|nr:CpaD family pilus assembly lipoprotein [Sphingomicrobium sp.]
MRSKTLLLLAVSTALAGCQTAVGQDVPERGVASVNVPVVTTADYVFDASAPGGALAPGESERLNGWFQGLGLGYGDAVFVDGAYSPAAREQVARVAGQYGMLVSDGAPVTQGAVQPGAVRVVVSRRRAEVPNCPNWSRPSAPDFANRSMSNFGCSVNSNIAMQVANPEDLLHGQNGGAVADAITGAKAVQFYRSAPPTGTKGLQDISTKGSK